MSELRRDPVTGRWVIVTAEHSRRPGDFTSIVERGIDPSRCPFCEGHEAIAGSEILAWRPHGSPPNTPGWLLRVVPNREPVLRVEAGASRPIEHVFQTLDGLGAHEIVIETPHHDATLASLPADGVRRVWWAWRERIRDLKRDVRLKAFVVVKNHGAVAGARQVHAHSQVLAMPLVPPVLAGELAGAAAYHVRTGACVFCDIVQYESELERRVVSADTHAILLAPFASRVPFEFWILPRAHAAAFEEASDEVLDGMAACLQDGLRRLERVLPGAAYHLTLHTAPVLGSHPGASGAAGAEGDSRASFHWHLEVLPRLRPVSGLEWGSGLHVNAVPPEEAAEVLRAS